MTIYILVNFNLILPLKSNFFIKKLQDLKHFGHNSICLINNIYHFIFIC